MIRESVSSIRQGLRANIQELTALASSYHGTRDTLPRGMTELWGRLVVVDDDRQFVRALSKRVEPLVGKLLTCTSASGPFELPPTHEADVALSSTRLLGATAVGLVRQVRASDHRAVLIARAWAPDGVDAVLLFDAGADDCVGAGDDLTVLEARIRRALCRRRCCERCTQRPQSPRFANWILALTFRSKWA